MNGRNANRIVSNHFRLMSWAGGVIEQYNVASFAKGPLAIAGFEFTFAGHQYQPLSDRGRVPTPMPSHRKFEKDGLIGRLRCGGVQGRCGRGIVASRQSNPLFLEVRTPLFICNYPQVCNFTHLFLPYPHNDRQNPLSSTVSRRILGQDPVLSLPSDIVPLNRTPPWGSSPP